MWISSPQMPPYFPLASLPLINNFMHLAHTNVVSVNQAHGQTSVILPKQKKIQKCSLKQPVYQWQDIQKTDCLQGWSIVDFIVLCRFKTLSVEQRREATQINEDLIVQMVIRFSGQQNLSDLKISIDLKNLERQNEFYEKFMFRDFKKRQQLANKERLESELLRNVEIACFGKPSLLLNSTLLENTDLFFECLEMISSGNIFEGPKKSLESGHGILSVRQDNPLWFSSFAFNNLTEWLCSSLQKKMLNMYETRSKHTNLDLKYFLSDNIIMATQFIKFCHKNHNLDQKFSQKYLNSIEKWSFLRINDKNFQEILQFQQLSQNLFQLFNEQKTQELFETLNQPKEAKKKSKKINKTKKLIKKIDFDTTSISNKQTQNDTVNNSEEFQRDQESISVNCDKNDFQTQVLIVLPEQKEKQQLIKQQQVKQVKQVQQIIEIKQIEQEQQKNQQNASLVHEVKQEEKQQVSQIQTIEQYSKQQTIEKAESNTYQTKQTMSHSHSEQQSIEIVKKKKHQPKKKKKLSQKIAESLFDTWIDQNVESFVDNLSVQSNKQMQARIIAFERIRHFASLIFANPQIQAVLFGSNAVGLSLPTSDIDILLKGLEIPTQLTMTQLLQKFSSQLKKMQWVVECTILPQAKVPIIKLLVNLNFRFGDSFVYGFQHSRALQSFNGCFELSNPFDSLISVDVTLDMKGSENNQMGCDSTSFMKDRLAECDQLYRNVLIIKYLLQKKGLNKTYKGGLSSYSVLLLCASYLKEHPQQSYGASLMNILQFYSSVFNNQKQMILFHTENNCFKDILFESQDECPNPITLIDPLNSRVMTTNCTSFNSIKHQFSRMYHRIMNVRQIMKEELKKLDPSQLKPYEEKKKCCQRFVKKYLQNYKLKNIIDQQFSSLY